MTWKHGLKRNNAQKHRDPHEVEVVVRGREHGSFRSLWSVHSVLNVRIDRTNLKANQWIQHLLPRYRPRPPLLLKQILNLLLPLLRPLQQQRIRRRRRRRQQRRQIQHLTVLTTQRKPITSRQTVLLLLLQAVPRAPLLLQAVTKNLNTK